MRGPDTWHTNLLLTPQWKRLRAGLAGLKMLISVTTRSPSLTMRSLGTATIAHAACGDWNAVGQNRSFALSPSSRRDSRRCPCGSVRKHAQRYYRPMAIEETKGDVLSALEESAKQAAKSIQLNFQTVGNFLSGSAETDRAEVCPAEDEVNLIEQDNADRVDSDRRGERSGFRRHAMNDDNLYADTEGGVTQAQVMEGGRNVESAEESTEQAKDDSGASSAQESVQEECLSIVDNLTSGISEASEQVQSLGQGIRQKAEQMMHQPENESDDSLARILVLKPEDHEKAYIEIDDLSAKESILL